MFDKVANDTKVYSVIQGLEQLHAEIKNNPKAARKDVAQQFESILMQMMLSSMRDANKAFSSDLFSNDQMDFYQDFFDKQMAQEMSRHGGVGFAKTIEKNIIQNESPEQLAAENALVKTPSSLKQTPLTRAVPTSMPEPASILNLPKPLATPAPEKQPETFSSPKEFIKSLWPAAKNAAMLLGTSPDILLAQAALETNWGKKVLPESSASSTHNLFNIKAGDNWDKKTTTLDSLEQKDGVLVKEKSTFRSYSSYGESFLDYVKFLKEHNRYANALSKATNPQEFVKALQNAGFATDTKYADKILNIFTSHSFKDLVREMK